MTSFEESVRHQRATSFGAVADFYVKGRPTYPPAAAGWALEGIPGRRVVDVGAGTGKLTATLVGLGYDVTAVEPLDEMRAALSAGLPQVTAVAGSAEQIPVPDGSADAVVAAQAFHWFDPPRALAEMARILVPGGAVGLMWNSRDDSVPWVAQLSELLKIPVDTVSHWDWSDGEPLRDHPAFEHYEQLAVPNVQIYTRERMYNWARSTSGFATMDADERDERLARIGQFVREEPALRGRDEFEMPFMTMTMRARRRA